MIEGENLLKQVAEHAKVAERRGLVFHLAERRSAETDWERVGEDEPNLLALFAEAMRRSRQTDADVGIVCELGGIGLVYWNSKRPDLLNDVAVRGRTSDA